MTKSIVNLRVVQNQALSALYSLLKLTPTDGTTLPAMLPGQFVQVEISQSKNTFLRRPISICNVDVENNELWLLVRKAGEGTASLIASAEGDVVNVILPLGNGFSMPAPEQKNLLLIGGGVGVAPLLQLGKSLRKNGFEPSFLLGARSVSDLLLVDEFEKVGHVYLSTDDGSAGEIGVVTQHSCLSNCSWDMIYCCGPAPMMKAVAGVARNIGASCEVSLENMMACGLGACLCCVEKTVKGNVCVCTEGPVFNIEDLTW